MQIVLGQDLCKVAKDMFDEGKLIMCALMNRSCMPLLVRNAIGVQGPGMLWVVDVQEHESWQMPDQAQSWCVASLGSAKANQLCAETTHCSRVQHGVYQLGTKDSQGRMLDPAPNHAHCRPD